MSGRGVIHLRLRYHATKQISFIFILGRGTSDDWTGELRLSMACGTLRGDGIECSEFRRTIPKGTDLNG